MEDIDPSILVKAALSVAGGSRSELGRMIGLESYAEDQIGRWLRGDGPNYTRTIALLHVAGWLNESRVRSALDLAQKEADEALRRTDELQSPPEDEGVNG